MLSLLAATIAAPVGLEVLTLPRRALDPGEWRVTGLPRPENPYDRREWRIRAQISRPGKRRSEVDGFWHQSFTLSKAPDGKPLYRASGPGEWRLRYAPMEAGAHKVEVTVFRQGKVLARARTQIKAGAPSQKGFVRRSAQNPGYLAFSDGAPFIPIGMNTCWWNDKFLDDYRRWAERMQKSGMNYARLWMSPWCFGIEHGPGTLGRYDLGPAWALDETIRIFRDRGIQVILCLDYHGMLQTTKDFWGANDNWQINPYNAALGGPAKTQNEFFTSPESRRLYEQRLRYIISRYGAYSNVAAWEFWNEVDNVRQHFREEDMIAWHKHMAQAARKLDPYGRLVTTSLTHDGFPTLWTEARLDLVQSHSYNQANPGVNFAERAATFRSRYGLPWIMGEYGVDYRAPMQENDPKNRGLKQALWGSLLGGSAGSAQSWWWETLDAQNIYPMFRSLSSFAASAPLGSRGWAPLAPRTQEESDTLPPLKAGGAPFGVKMDLPLTWGEKSRGTVLLTDAIGAGAQASKLNGYLHGTSKPDLVAPFRLKGWFGQNGKVTLKVNSVSDLADLRILVGGREVLAKAFPDKDGKHESVGEYGEEVSVPVPPGLQVIEVKNVGRDWASVDWVSVDQALPTQAASRQGAFIRAAASGTTRQAVVWVVDPAYSYPANAKVLQARTVSGAWLELPQMEPGRYRVRWWNTEKGGWIKTETVATQGPLLRLSPPPFQEDIAARVEKASR